MKPILKTEIDFFLSKEERESPVWQSLKARLEKKLTSLREKNDDQKLTDMQTATLRGHIDCLKAVIALGNEPPPKVVPDARPQPRIDLGAKYG